MKKKQICIDFDVQITQLCRFRINVYLMLLKYKLETQVT